MGDATVPADSSPASISGFTTSLTWEEVPADVRKRTLWLSIDARACMEAGQRLRGPKIMADFVAQSFGTGSARSFLDGRLTSAPGAALVNGTLMNSLDLDDGHPVAKGHPGGVVIPAALAVADMVNAGPEDLAAAIVVGYEVAVRAAVHQQSWLENYHSSGSWGAIGAAAAACRLLRLDRRSTEHALGLAEYHAPLDLVMYAVADPAMSKDAMGWGAHVGVSSALLAEAGFTSTGSTFLAVAADHGLRETWEIRRLYVKQYPCCRWVHPALDSAHDLLDSLSRQALHPDEVDRVEVHIFDTATKLSADVPRSSEEAQFNFPWPIASMLATGRFDVQSVTTDLDNEEILGMFTKIHAVVDPELSGEFPETRRSRVKVTLHDGKTVSAPLRSAKGDAEDPEWEKIIATKSADYIAPILNRSGLSEPDHSDSAEAASAMAALFAAPAKGQPVD